MSTPHLIHCCGRNKTPDEANTILMKILQEGRFKPSAWKILRVAASGLRIEVRPEDSTAPDADALTAAQAEYAAAAIELSGLKFRMTCFTDLPPPSLQAHSQLFGSFAIALRKDSSPAQRCHPVQYVPRDSLLLNLFVLAKQMRKAQALLHDRISKLNAANSLNSPTLDTIAVALSGEPLVSAVIATDQDAVQRLEQAYDKLEQLRPENANDFETTRTGIL